MGDQSKSSPWSAEKLAEAEILWRDRGLSARAIAERLGVTKNAFLGMAHRHGWQRVAPAKPVKSAKPRLRSPPAKPKPRPPALLRPRLDRPNLPGMSLMELDSRTCRWPISSAGVGIRFCGVVDNNGAVYCRQHLQQAYGRHP